MVLITGAAGGIGSATAEIFAKNQYDVIVSDVPAREEELNVLATKLEKKYSIRGYPIIMDVTRVESIEKALNTLKSTYQIKKINVLVNNAGKSMLTLIEETDLTQAHEIIDIMLKGPINMTILFLPLLRAALPKASIITVSSLAAKITPPFLGFYAAAKLGMDKVIETWRYELEYQGFHLGIIHVGATKTNIVRKGYLSPTLKKIFRVYDECQKKKKITNKKEKHQCAKAQNIVKFFERQNQVPPEQVAKKIFEMVQKKKKQMLVSRGDAFILKTHRFTTKLAKKEFQRLCKITNEFK